MAAKRIRSQCGEADMDEEQRITTSISMTLCEIATGNHYSIPLECRDFYASGPVSSQHSAPVKAAKASHCVDALSRSAQFWSSYSGYLREMRACSPDICVLCSVNVTVLAQLCYAFRRWNEIDLAKNLYQNATLEKIALINLLSARERDLNDAVGAWKRDFQASQAPQVCT
ncbi:hypothetical protein AN958_00440 [Leucoagaricus sp. SymC.cos]|nr:hypothetical protein AN958_00440 [Leucoagaricus sp. SymC.cos]